MLISPSIISKVWGLRPASIVHVGAHHGEEMGLYSASGWGSEKVLWIEALPEKAEAVKKKILEKGLTSSFVECATCWSEAGIELDFHETNNGESSSVLPLGEHATEYPEIKVVKRHKFISRRLDEVVPQDFGTIDLLNLDIQGAELEALKGLGSRINMVSAVYSEINLRPLYRGGAMLGELDDWLREQGFDLVDLHALKQGWGDALWVRSSLATRRIRWRQFLRVTLQKQETLQRLGNALLNKVRRKLSPQRLR